ncbi:MAG: hypothetical protein UV71_C0001G0153 [Microgenomates group bacterium GW2011_GWC1_43_13]|uniref:Glycerophosphoryl diester phosphodiesterase membrane domain-containing protein n=3 Tax=Candidatus Woeseibacteriota TaxID=1752722 RepID=A0A837IFZ3_9BACT|nr:MAG: hypothetical protein UV71_C0001G0153 [Microgenomates group bacterium GW2011_GWC1_43_13]KKT32323.1 MAG: hypothetical protein UW20_C0017G0002 [Candidatus Woesebacteria bacterium GW2011_GWB1_44_11]KKT54874.1 MAG: hypothetical protein UW47_C0002G0058 [Candidatus Woesebacteria bacterium GW2011_GWA1_44_23]OGM76085.1 MAG: hypothetical protein A2208_02680 [Candidatus Woesebacteria bacterium RIFOXYA1_FULL_43_16]OGM81991.1 MAG: hypothetical protein A2394_03245 [Candidatus Woesebacteria bacterium 
MQKLSSPFGLIKKAVNIFAKKENFYFLVKIYLPLLPFSILSGIQNYLPVSVADTSVSWFSLGLGVLQVLSLLVGAFTTVSGIIALRKVAEGEELSVKKTFMSAWKVYWAFLLLSTVLTLAYLFGFILLIVPGLLFIVWFAFSRFVMVEKNTGVKLSLLKSRQLVKGVYWEVLGRLIVFGMFTVIIQIILSMVPYGVGSVVNSLSGGLYMLPLYLLYRELSV